MSSATNTMTGMDRDSIKEHLFKIAMKSQWEEVVQAYRQSNNLAREAKITKSGYTALHIAVSDGQEEYVEKLVKLVSKNELEIQNERGNTPLHLAAAQGNVRMCECIAKDHPSLVGILNNHKETPLFLAALHGKKDAFLCLHYICTPGKSQPNYSYCRRQDGETILHCAIAGDYFDLAFQIIALYRDLVNSVNEDGFSPLHLLASKPSAFKSGSYLRPWSKIIYHCILVDELKVEEADHFHERVINTINSENAPKYPENYKTCINFLLVFWKMAQVFDNVTRKEGKGTTDPENPEPKGGNPGHYNACFDYVDPEKPEPKGGNPGHYNACFDYVKLLSKAMLIVLGLGGMATFPSYGSTEIQKIRNNKEKHKWAVQIMNKLLKSSSMYEYEDSGMNPQAATADETSPYKISDGGDRITLGSIEEQKGGIREGSLPPEVTQNKTPEMEKKETPILIAAKNGITEMVEKILELFPVAIHDLNAQKKNIVLLAVENRQPHVYQLLLRRKTTKDSVFRKVDKDGNSALHLAAKLGGYKPWLIPGAALQMHWEIKWYEFVKNSMPRHFFVRYNMKQQTAMDMLIETHTDLVRGGTEWLYKTSESCSVLAALIVTVAFATATTVPGGINQDTGRPTFENHRGFELYTLSSLAAVCFSFTSMVIFLSIVMSQTEQEDFGEAVPRKLLLGITTLFLSMVAMLMSFCIGHSFILKHNRKYAAFPVYVVSCSPIAYFVILQFPVYYNLVGTYFKVVPVRCLNRP